MLLLGGINYDSNTNSLKLLNTAYKSTPGVLWNTSTYNLDDEFHITTDLNIKNFTKKEELENLIDIQQDFISNRHRKDNNKKYIQINYIMHTSKNFPNQPPVSINDMVCFFNFQFNLIYDNKEDPSKLTSVKLILHYINKNKEINKKIYEIDIDKNTLLYKDKMPSNILSLFKPGEKSHIMIDFKDNVLTR